MLPFEFLGPYRLIEPIGRGGMGTVYRAIHEKTRQQVAIKLIAATVADDPRFRRRFASEIETLKRLKHPNIVTLIGYGEESGHLFYSMELVEGESLQQRLRRERRLAWPPMLDMAIEICAALKHAHDFGVIHRDLKPANLLFDPQGNVKLVDFGIAKLFGHNDQTAAGSVLGTADFMAPEQAGDGSITPRTDLYALGNVLYACFAGRPPFAGRTLTQVIDSLRQESPPRIDLFAPDLPEEIAELIHDLLKKRPEDRPPTALAVMNRMKAIRAGLNRLATQGGGMGDTVGRQESAPRSGPPDIATPTQLSDPDQKTLGNFDDGRGTSTPPPESDQPTMTATDPNGIGLSQAVTPRHPLAQSLVPGGPTVPPDAGRGKSAQSRRTDAPTDAFTDDRQGTHFRTVDDHDRRRGVWDSEPNEDRPANHFWHWLSIASMLAALVLGAAIFVWATRIPEPEELFSSIMEAHDGEDIDSVRARGDQFLRLFPRDERAAELKVLLEEANAQQVVRRLRLAATREGGFDQLPAEEQGFLLAMSERKHDPLTTRQRLQQWLNLYAPGGESLENPFRSVPRQMMIRAAQAELKRLQESPLPLRDQRAAELFARIEWARDNLDSNEQQKLLLAIIALYSDKPWAKEAVDEAKRLTGAAGR
jgi:serine/threonine protein kinase